VIPVIDRVIQILGKGSYCQAAIAMGKYPTQLAIWRKKGFIPAQFALLVEERTAGAVTAREVMLEAERLRPARKLPRAPHVPKEDPPPQGG